MPPTKDSTSKNVIHSSESARRAVSPRHRQQYLRRYILPRAFAQNGTNNMLQPHLRRVNGVNVKNL